MDCTDAQGTRHVPASGRVRIASLVPSLTETLFALGLGAQVVARTGFCIHPREAVRRVPKVGGTKSVRLDALRALAPTHCLVNIDENERPTVEALRRFVPHVVVTHPIAPQDNLALFALLGALFGREAQAAALTARWQAAHTALSSAPQHAHSVLYLIWKDPWMAVAQDTYIARMLALTGARTWPAVQGGASGAARYPRVDLQAAAQAGVQRVLLSSEPYRFGPEHVRDVQALLPQAQVQCVDGELCSWYGSRSIEGLQYLRSLAQAWAGGGENNARGCP